MNLRSATLEDAPHLARIRARAFRTPWSEQAFVDLLNAPEVFGCVDPAGFALARAAAGEAELLLLAVDPEARRRGLGRALLRAVLDEARDRQVEALFLEVAADNQAALALYEAEAFAPVGRRPAYYGREDGPAADALVLRRALSPSRP